MVTMALVLTVSAEQGLLKTSRFNRSNRTGNTAPAAAPTASKTSDPGASKVDVGGRSIEFNGAALDIVLMVYGNLVGKTVLKDPAAPAATITLQPRQGQELSDEDKILAIETVLEMNGVHLEPYGEKFIRALPRGTVRKDGIPLFMDSEAELGETTKVVSMMLTFQNIALDEAQKALEGLKSDKGVLNVFERTSSILVTDTEMNINRMREIARKIDVPTPVTENVFVRQVKYAAAADIKTALEAIVQDSQKALEKEGKQANSAQASSNTMTAHRFLGGRNNNKQPATPTVNESLVTSVSDADRGMIRGKVLILSDERSNKLIVITSKSNMDFFDKVIEQLDVETTPDIVVKVYRLKYADAEDVSDMINDLIGNAVSSKSSSKGNQNQNAKNGTGANVTRTTTSAAKGSANQRSGDAKTGELSKDNTTVLADKRINGLVVMTNKELVPTLEQIIESMDIKLSQVLIETCIIEVGLGHGIKTGIDWVNGIQKSSYTKSDGTVVDVYRQALGAGGGDTTTIAGVATNALIDGVSRVLPSIFTPGGAGLNYAVFSEKLNLAAVISMSQTDSTSKYIASPVVMTVDNKEATIEATQARKFLSGYQSNSSSSYYGSSIVPQYEGKDIGIKIKVTPKINPNGTVMLEVEEEYSQVGPQQTIQDPNSKPVQIDTALTRKMSADVVLDNQQTVVLGGLTDTLTETSDAGIPILKDIPWIGKYLFGKTETSETRSELMVFLTPYVLADGNEAEAEAMRRKQALSNPNAWDDHGWSKSKLADPVTKKEQLRRLKDRAKKQDEERETQIAIEQWKVDRVKELKSMSKKERDLWLEMHKDELVDEEEQEALEEKMENTTSDEKTQSELKDLAEEVREKKLAEAEEAIKANDEKMAGQNERAKLDAAEKEKASE